jgi:TatD DNase family protein
VLIDSHAHLIDRRFAKDLGAVLDRAKENGVEVIINVGYDLESSFEAVNLAREYDFIYTAVGIHPHDAARVPEDYLSKLKEFCRHTRVIAVGEIGLDYYRKLSPRLTQRRIFREQLALARELDLPVIIHDREAHQEVMEILSKDKPPQAGGVIHCFSGDREMALACISMGFYISFAGPITFSKANQVHEVVVQVPLEKILIETDAPYLAPQSKRGQRNEPAHVRFVGEKIALLKSIPFTKVAAITTANAKNLFKISP